MDLEELARKLAHPRVRALYLVHMHARRRSNARVHVHNAYTHSCRTRACLPAYMRACMHAHIHAHMHNRKQVPTFANPRGTTVPTAQRAQIVELCRTHGVVIFADEGADAYLGDCRPGIVLRASRCSLRWAAPKQRVRVW